MQTRLHTQGFVAATAAISAGLAGWIYYADPSYNGSLLVAALSFAAVATASQILAYERPVAGARGSAAFLPFLVAAVLAPHWTGLLAAGTGILLAELFVRRPLMKAFFNVSQTVASLAVGIIVYTSLGGASPLLGGPISIWALAVALPAYLFVNTAAVSGVIAASTRQRFLPLFTGQSASTVLYDLLALPFVYVFAWLYVQFGVPAAAILAIPLLGIRELYKTNYQLQQTNRELLELMVAAIEARDPYTSGHSRRVAANARLIAEFLGVPRKQVERIFIAALLHDVGKIHEVFGPILSKPGRLTTAEHDIMKTHSAKGAELIQNVSSLRDIVPVVRNHHENWDGTGYPDGLAGETIPLGSRIIMVADTIDAMMSDRPYRAALTPLQVRAELVRMRAQQFDPHICDSLLNNPMWQELFVNVPHVHTTGQQPRLTPSTSRRIRA
jgi:putative nucleotidyltransferase with HDIG domain